MKAVGILTGGGDAPGLNAVIRAVVRTLVPRGFRTVGIRHGWRGLLDGEVIELDLEAVEGILPLGGTILGTSRTNPYKKPEDARRAEDAFRTLGLDAASRVLVIGSEGATDPVIYRQTVGRPPEEVA